MRGPARRFLGVLAAVLVLAGGCSLKDAAAPPSGAGPGSYRLDAGRTVLESGLRVLHVRRENLPMVRLTLLLDAGSVHDPEGKAGLASMTATLLTEGTARRTSMQIAEETEFIGASLGASASADYAIVSLSVLTKDLDKGFDLLSDVLLNPAFPQEELGRKRKEALGALKQRREDPSYLASVRFREMVYGKGPYGRLTSGDESSLPGLTRADIARFYSGRYRPEGAILSVVGDISRADLDALMDKYLSGWKPGLLPGSSHEPPAAPAFRVSSIDRQLKQATIMMGHAGIERSHPDYYAVQVMNYVLGGGGFSSRLMDRLRDQLGLTYGVYSSFDSFMYGGDFSIDIQTRNEAAVQAIREIRSEVRAMVENGVTPEELAGAKAYLTGSFPRRISTMASISSFLAVVEFYGLGLDYPETYAQRINAVTADDVLRVAREHLMQDDITLVVVGDLEKAGFIANTPDLSPLNREP